MGLARQSMVGSARGAMVGSVSGSIVGFGERIDGVINERVIGWMI